jgi:hypothetical protein
MNRQATAPTDSCREILNRTEHVQVTIGSGKPLGDSNHRSGGFEVLVRLLSGKFGDELVTCPGRQRYRSNHDPIGQFGPFAVTSTQHHAVALRLEDGRSNRLHYLAHTLGHC